MAITEITTIVWKAPHTWESATVRTFIERLLPNQMSSSGYPLYFFQCERGEETEMVTLTGWESVAAHLAWVRDVGVPLLGEYAGSVLEVRGQIHIDVDFARVPGDLEYVVWEMGEGEELERERLPTQSESEWQATGKILDEGQKGSCTLRGFVEKPDGVEVNAAQDDGTRVVLVRLNSIP